MRHRPLRRDGRPGPDLDLARLPVRGFRARASSCG